MSQKLRLKWDDFQENLNIAFGSLREDNEFADVTLASEDGQQMDAHEVILAASSPFFQSLLKMNKHPLPLIYMRGVKSENLLAVVDFLYRGEANVYQENLDSFLAIAEELQLKGLMGQTELILNTNPTPQEMIRKPFHKMETSNLNNFESKIDKWVKNEQRIEIPNFVSGDLQQLDEKVKSMMDRSENLLPNGKERAKICKLCGKEGSGITITH